MLRRVPLKRTGAIARKRAVPRRNEGRVQHPRRSKAKTAQEKRHHRAVAAMPCIACGSWPVHVHHVISDGFRRISRNHKLVLPVCPECHQNGPTAIHKIGTRAWNDLHGIDQLERSKRLWEASA